MKRIVAIGMVAAAITSAPAVAQTQEYPVCDDTLGLPAPDLLPAVIDFRVPSQRVFATADGGIAAEPPVFVDLQVMRPDGRVAYERGQSPIIDIENPAPGDYRVVARSVWELAGGFACATVSDALVVIAQREVSAAVLRAYANRSVSRIRGALRRERPDLVQREIDAAQFRMFDLRSSRARVEVQWSAWRRQVNRFERAFEIWRRFGSRYAEGRMVVEGRRLRVATDRIGTR